MSTIVENVIDCWIINENEFAIIQKGSPFTPLYTVFNYFRLNNRIDANTIEGYVGHKEMPIEFHDSFLPQYNYFEDFLNRKKVYMTMDKVNFYEIDEIIPSKPLSFVFARVNKPKSSISIKSLTGLKPATTLQPIHFEDLLGNGFERLVHSYVETIQNDGKVDWLGETGGDQGRDVWVESPGGSYCYQCANYREMTFKKGKEDLDALVRNSHSPDHLIMVCGGRISPTTKEKIQQYALKLKFRNFQIWSGAEFEAKLYKQAPALIHRFFDGLISTHGEKRDQNNNSDGIDEPLPLLQVVLEPIFSMNGNDEDIAVFIEESFYLLKKGKTKYMEVEFIGEEKLERLLSDLKRQEKSAANRKQIIDLKKILDKLHDIRQELIQKVGIMFYMDRYPISDDYIRLAKSLRQLLLISISPDQLYEETEITVFVNGQHDQSEPAKTKGNTKIDLLGDMGGKIGCSIWLTDTELNKLIEGHLKIDQLRNLSFYGLECSDLEIDTLTEKAIPSLIDKIFDFKHGSYRLRDDDNSSWTHLSCYKIALG